MKKNIIKTSIYAIVLILIDQISKLYIINNLKDSSVKIIPNFLSFTYCKNTGVAFGFGQGNTIIFIICNIVILLILAKLIIFQNDRLNTISKYSLVTVFAGGTSNLIDRIFRSYVVDFIDINEFLKFPIFNIADICITIGIFIVFITSIKDLKNEIKEDNVGKNNCNR